MNKTEYMDALKKHLRRLPKVDFQTAVDYFEEYFADAGVEREAEVIEDLGSPEFAASQIITTLALNNAKEPVKDVKKGLNAVWVGILALCAAPVALPAALLLIMVIILFLFCVFLTLALFTLCGVLLVIYSPMCIIGSFTVITRSVPVFISCLGAGFTSLGIGLIITFGSFWICKLLLTAVIRGFGRMIGKGKKKSEKI